MMKKVWPIQNLDCAACAAKLEDALSRVPGVEKVSVNYLNATLTLVADDSGFDQVTESVLAKAAKVEPDAIIVTDDSVHPDGAQTRQHDGHDHRHASCCCCHDDHEHEHCDPHDDHEHECCGSHHDHRGDCGSDHNHRHGESAAHGAAEKRHGIPALFVRVIGALTLMAAALLMPQAPSVLRITLFLSSYLIVGWDVLWKALKNIRRGQIFDENFLMTIASIGAVAMGEYPEAIAVMSLYQIGEWFQDRAVEKSRASIASLMDIRPDSANLLENGEIRTVHPDTVGVGDLIVIRPGEKVPLDGTVTEGVSSLNTVALTGESLPRDVGVGDSVLSGCVNLSGVLTVRVSSVFGESTVAKILRLVESSGDSKAQTEKFITKFARYYTPAVCAAALLLAVVPSLATGDWSKWIMQALSFLVISCPCALVISVPLSFFSGIGGASRKGILIKGANHLETLSRLDAIAFDKTGTLTRGMFSVTAIHSENVCGEELLDIAAHAESYSTHPISQSLRAAHKAPLDPSRVTDVEEIAGRGLKAVVDGKQVYVGNDSLMEAIGLTPKPCQTHGTVVHAAREGQYLGHIVISDMLRLTAKQAVAELKEAGVNRLVMLTGDRRDVAEEMAESVGMTEVKAELLPADKVNALAELLDGDCTVGFAGDGINDAPVLRRADVGIAMGAMGSDAAIEAADVVLMDDDPVKLPLSIRIARRTMGIVRQNIVLALGVKALILALGFLGIANMWLAVFADVGVAILAILNAMRAMNCR